MSWANICADPVLQNLPYKIQTDKWGNIVMSPASNEHGVLQAKLVVLLSRLITTGTVITECSVQTHEGVKVADVAWASSAFMQKHRGQTPFVEAPEICVEILSLSNSALEMTEKRQLYFTGGAKECWLCDQTGRMRFYKNTGPLSASELVEDFPAELAVD